MPITNEAASRLLGDMVLSARRKTYMAVDMLNNPVMDPFEMDEWLSQGGKLVQASRDARKPEDEVAK